MRNTIKYFLSLFSIKSLVFEAAYLSRVRLFFFAFLVENDQKLNSDEANNFENNINLTMINWVEEKNDTFSNLVEFDLTVEYHVRLKQQKRRVIPQTEYCLPFEVARLGEKQVLS